MARKLRYLDIADVLRKKISQGVFPQGKALPSQKELSEIFNTSVMTIRGSLAQLEQEGIITVIHGVGTFVSAPAVHSETLSLQGFQNEMDRQKMAITNRIHSLDRGNEDPGLARLFGHQQGSYASLARIRSIDGTTIIFQKSYVESTYSSVLETYTAEKSLYQYFSDTTGIMIIQGREITTPVILPLDIAEILGISEPCTAFLSKRISISLEDEVVLYDEAYLPGPYVIMTSCRHGKHNSFKYIINQTGTIDTIDSFNDSDLWEDLI